jgi:hypothetical protein
MDLQTALANAIVGVSFTPKPRKTVHRVPKGTIESSLTPRMTIPQGAEPRTYHLGYAQNGKRVYESARTFGLRSKQFFQREDAIANMTRRVR